MKNTNQTPYTKNMKADGNITFQAIETAVFETGKVCVAHIIAMDNDTGEIIEADGKSQCSPTDTFDPTIGKSIAINRAKKIICAKALETHCNFIQHLWATAEAQEQVCARLSDRIEYLDEQIDSDTDGFKAEFVNS